MSTENLEGPAMPGGPSISMADLDHDDKGPRLIACAAVTWTIALVSLVLRFYTRIKLVNRFGLSDWFILLSLVAATEYLASLIAQVHYGTGKHVWDINPNDFTPMMEAWWFSLLGYGLTITFAKISICLLYLNIFTFEWARRGAWIILCINVAVGIWAFVATMTNCIPLKSVWDPTVPSQFCHSEKTWIATSALVPATDFLMFLLPIPFVIPLRLPLRQKLIVVAVFAIGFFECLISGIRLGALFKVKGGDPDPDFFYNSSPLTYLTFIEANTAIVVACCMTLKPLIAKWFPNFIDPQRGGWDGAGDGADGNGSKNSPVGMDDGPPLTIGSQPIRQPSKDGINGEGRILGVDEVLGHHDVEKGLATPPSQRGNAIVRGYSGFEFGFGGDKALEDEKKRRPHFDVTGDDKHWGGASTSSSGGSNSASTVTITVTTSSGTTEPRDRHNRNRGALEADPHRLAPAGDSASERTDPDLGRVATATSIP